jgi:hypothetical protein
VAQPNVHCHQVLPFTRALVSSLAITWLARTSAAIRSAGARLSYLEQRLAHTDAAAGLDIVRDL